MCDIKIIILFQLTHDLTHLVINPTFHSNLLLF